MNILIVDDDDYLVKKIADGIVWDEIGIDHVYHANNIQQAKKIFTSLPVDILLTDIEMPGGSGLELVEWIRDEKYPVECIYLSSYAYFAYAQKALSLNSKAYLLKPISNKELTKKLEEIVTEMNGKKKKYPSQRDDKNQIFNELINSKNFAKSASTPITVQLKKYFINNKFQLLLIRVFPDWSMKKQEDMVLVDSIIVNKTNEFFYTKRHDVEIVKRWREFEWCIVFRESDEQEDLLQEIKTFRERLHQVVTYDVCYYLGSACAFEELDRSRQVLENIIRTTVPDVDDIFLESHVNIPKPLYHAPPLAFWEKELIVSEKFQEVKQKFYEYLDDIIAKKETTVDIFELLKRDLIQMVYSYLKKKGLLASQIFSDHEFDIYNKSAIQTQKGMRQFIKYLFNQLEGNRNLYKEDLSPIEQTKRYIDDHLHENLSRYILAKKVFLSEDYLSKRFGTEIGMSIPNYIAQQRVEKAKLYLKTTNLPVSTIAINVGYTNFSYFSRTFKNYTGKTPNEYRSNR